MANKKPPLMDPSGDVVATDPAIAPTRFRPAREALPFARTLPDGTTRLWPEQPSLNTGHSAQRRVEGERWALELLRYYRQYGHEPAARVLPDLIRHGVESGGVEEEQFTGVVRVLDAMLAFAARQTDLDAYAGALDSEHQRTLAAWAALDVGG
jgi:hypothetical protein